MARDIWNAGARRQGIVNTVIRFCLRELHYIAIGVKRSTIWLVDKRYYIIGMWIIVWLIPTIIDIIRSLPKTPRQLSDVELVTGFLHRTGVEISRVLPVWSFEVNKQWVTLGVFIPAGLLVTSLLIILFLIQVLREASQNR